MRAVVTGGAGFIGRHVAERLLADGMDVTSIDLRDEGHPGAPRAVVDLCNPGAVAAIVQEHDVVCHIGAIGDVYLAAEQPALAASVNVTGTANVAAAAKQADARIVYASTWEVYGRPEYEPIDERHRCDPDHPYNITKLAGERIALAADHLQDVPVVALRLGTAYGPGLRPNSVFRIFLDRARRGDPITIQGDGSQSRQFTHADDIARAFSMAARSDVRGMALNIVSNEAVSIKALAEAIVAEYPTDLAFGPARPGDVPPAIVSSVRARELLGWEPEVDFEEGLSRFIASVPDPDRA